MRGGLCVLIYVYFQVTHVWNNFTKKVNPKIKTSGCYYTGKVKGDERSTVSVSLCGGMVSNLTNNQNFYNTLTLL